MAELPLYRNEDDLSEKSRGTQQFKLTGCAAYETVLKRAKSHQQSQDNRHDYENIPLQHLRIQSHRSAQAKAPTKQMASHSMTISDTTTHEDPLELSNITLLSPGLQAMPQRVDDDKHVYILSDITSERDAPINANTLQQDAIYENLR